jgi:hypothetical protein
VNIYDEIDENDINFEYHYRFGFTQFVVNSFQNVYKKLNLEQFKMIGGIDGSDKSFNELLIFDKINLKKYNLASISSIFNSQKFKGMFYLNHKFSVLFYILNK